MQYKTVDDDTNKHPFDVIGTAIEVYKALGNGLLEAIYQNALCVDLAERRIPFEKEKPIRVICTGTNYVLSQNYRLPSQTSMMTQSITRIAL